MAKIYRIGDPENDAERKAIREFGAKLPEEYIVFHNFEITTRRGFPYEVDAAVIGPNAIYLLEVKGYKGRINGDPSRWRLLPSGASHANPIPLTNRKARVLHDKLADKDRALHGTLIVALIVLTDDNIRVGNLRDDRRDRVLRIDEAVEFIMDRDRLPIRDAKSIQPLHNRIVSALNGSSPSKKTENIGLYEVLEKINQTDRRTVYLAKHRYLRSRPKTVLQVYHFDPYLKEEERENQITSIFHDQEAMSQLACHDNIISAGEMFAWEGYEFVLPHEFIEEGQTLEMLIAEENEPLSWAQKSKIVSGSARGLRHAHRHGVIHRDIRPLNIVVEPHESVAKLVNFDLALIDGRTEVKDWLGIDKELDRRYCAPEVWQDLHAATAASDIYSLGLVFYELICGERAVEDVERLFKDQSVNINREKIVEQLSSPDSETFMNSPEDVASVIHRMCRFSAQDRYHRLDEVIEDLQIIGD